jgi:predicted NUDIX family NTP pyrophosphohydrolase
MRSCGLLLYRLDPDSGLPVWIGHMGGPFWAKKDAAAWSIPKGEAREGEDDLAAARREFEEEIGHPSPSADWALLGEFVQPSRKVLVVFAGEGDFAVDALESNLFELEWPPRSGRMQQFPELDDARWFPLGEARAKVVTGQVAVLDALAARVAGGDGSRSG